MSELICSSNNIHKLYKGYLMKSTECHHGRMSNTFHFCFLLKELNMDNMSSSTDSFAV